MHPMRKEGRGNGNRHAGSRREGADVQEDRSVVESKRGGGKAEGSRTAEPSFGSDPEKTSGFGSHPRFPSRSPDRPQGMCPDPTTLVLSIRCTFLLFLPRPSGTCSFSSIGERNESDLRFRSSGWDGSLERERGCFPLPMGIGNGIPSTLNGSRFPCERDLYVDLHVNLPDVLRRIHSQSKARSS